MTKLPTELTLRDYFAAMAMQGMCAQQHADMKPNEEIVGAAFQMADAMLAKRDKNNDS